MQSLSGTESGDIVGDGVRGILGANEVSGTHLGGRIRLFRLIRSLVRPYRGTLCVILLAMLVETAMSVAGPWPLKIILDNVVGTTSSLLA